ncbi:hypothetical protein PPACK8108_LOCUS1424 [Phakopsora pachyrhizi]|uniref:Uncharacterized protein n=1 Tax=Phakopsora pachyrhizi TaxID=170000 RepID=A0AAV0AH38_PHAPC|nr:hypothetical protein PPACK8108_LOCUS1424 [Phakopsora pachyrhizi]
MTFTVDSDNRPEVDAIRVPSDDSMAIPVGKSRRLSSNHKVEKILSQIDTDKEEEALEVMSSDSDSPNLRMIRLNSILKMFVGALGVVKEEEEEDELEESGSDCSKQKKNRENQRYVILEESDESEYKSGRSRKKFSPEGRKPRSEHHPKKSMLKAPGWNMKKDIAAQHKAERLSIIEQLEKNCENNPGKIINPSEIPPQRKERQPDLKLFSWLSSPRIYGQAPFPPADLGPITLLRKSIEHLTALFVKFCTICVVRFYKWRTDVVMKEVDEVTSEKLPLAQASTQVKLQGLENDEIVTEAWEAVLKSTWPENVVSKVWSAESSK